MASIQRRTGPKVVGFYGILQPLADGIKLLAKEIVVPQKANKLLFLFAPLLSFLLSFGIWCVIPFDYLLTLCDIDFSSLYIFALSSLNVYGMIISGWSSNSKYAFLGAMRATAQVISYELVIGFVIITLALFAGSFNIAEIVAAQERTVWFIFPFLPLFLLFNIALLAETNRIPFDLIEAEAEIVAGYNVEYSSIIFAMFFLAEYANMLVASFLIVLLFFGGWLPGFNVFPNSFVQLLFYGKILLFVSLFVLVRSTLPRYRYDQLMVLGWKILLPVSFGFFIFYAGTGLLFNLLPFSFVFFKVY